MMSEIENFYGCYLLVSANVRFKGWTYIGFTVDPNRRVNQHNEGREKGGAWRTSGKGPWDMVLIIHGFPNKISALQFEWAWQNPNKSRKLKDICCRHKNLTGFKYRFAIVSEMLRTGPWNRLPLTVRWLNQDFVTEFAVDLQPPTHMPIAYGPVKISKSKKLGEGADQASQANSDSGSSICTICDESIKPQSGNSQSSNPQSNDFLCCLNSSCSMISHMVCLAKDFLLQENVGDMLMPVAGDCVLCATNLLWGDLIRQKQGRYQANAKSEQTDEGGGEEMVGLEDHWSAALTQQ